MSKVYDALKLAEEQRAGVQTANRGTATYPVGGETRGSHLRLALLRRWPRRKHGGNSTPAIETATLERINGIAGRMDRLEETTAKLVAAEQRLASSVEARLLALENELARRAYGSRERLRLIAGLSLAFVAALVVLRLVGR
jgi:hypothetical protein